MSSSDICDWQPQTDFDNELLAMHPDCDMTPENYKKTTLAGNYFRSIGDLKKEINQDTFEEGILPDIGTQILLLENATAVKPVGKQLIPASDSEEDVETFIREEEIITMQRKCGFNRHVEGIDSSKTVATINITKPYILSKKNGVPILLDQMYFKFENHNKTSGSSDITSTSSNSSKQKSDEIKHEVLKNSSTSEDGSTDVAAGRSHFQQHKLKFYTPRELYEMKKGRPKYTILNTKKTKKILNNSK